MVLRERKPLAPPVPDVWALAVDPKDELYVFHLAGTLRARGLRVVVDPGAARLDAKLRKAAKRGARVALLVGPEEREKGEAVVRDMRLKTQVSVAEREVVPTVTQTLSAG